MPDTRRTWAELAALFADNTAGAISAQDLRDFLASVQVHQAAAAPTTADDDAAGYDVWSVWIDTTGAPDIYVCTDASTGAAVWVQLYPATASIAWGDVTGTLADQTDLQAALDAKAATASLGTAAASDASDFATAAQGVLADTAVQPDDDANTLGSGTATDGQVLTADGAGNAAWEDVPAGGAVAWGDLTGTLSDQTDLQSALDDKADLAVTINAQTGTTYTLVLADAGKLITLTNASAITLTVPPNSSVAFAVGTVIALAQYGAGTVTVAAGAGVTINSDTSMLDLAGQYTTAALTKIATDEWLLTGALA